MGKMKGNFDIRKNPVFVIIFIFLLIRFFLNLDFFISFNYLSIFFAAVYLIFILMLLGEVRFFTVFLTLFLTVDSMIGAYLFNSGILGAAEFYATVLVNLAIIAIVVQNRDDF